jgi:N-acetylmuramoyl-L-alanine amidase
VGINRPNVVRIVFDLKTEVKPFGLPVAPVGEYKHRLVLDIYPKHPADPLAALPRAEADPVGEMAQAPLVVAQAPKEESPPLPVVKLAPKGHGAAPKAPERKAPEKKPKVDRLIIVAIDAGHGGEDSGARGRKAHQREGRDARDRAQASRRASTRSRTCARCWCADGDYFVPLAAPRRQVAPRAGRSLRLDPRRRVGAPDARGSSVFALLERGATSTAARMLAQREKPVRHDRRRELRREGPDPRRTLLDLSLTATINDSLKLGRAVLTELGRT